MSQGRASIPASSQTGPADAADTRLEPTQMGSPEQTDAAPAQAQASVAGDIAARSARFRGSTIKVVAFAAISTFFAALHVELGDAIFLVAASTSLALVGYWIAEHHLGGRGKR